MYVIKRLVCDDVCLRVLMRCDVADSDTGEEKCRSWESGPASTEFRAVQRNSGCTGRVLCGGCDSHCVSTGLESQYNCAHSQLMHAYLLHVRDLLDRLSPRSTLHSKRYMILPVWTCETDAQCG